MAVGDSEDLIVLAPQNEAPLMPGAEVASYVLGVIAVLVVLHFHLLPTVFAGLTVHVLTVKLGRRLPGQRRGLGHKFALAGVLATVVVLALLGVGLGLWSFLHGSRGMAVLLAVVAETLENAQDDTLPPDIAEAIPYTIEDQRAQITDMLRDHAHKISSAGIARIKTLVHVLFGMVIGGMTALHHFDPTDCRPFIAALYARTGALASAFDKVVFAEVKISALNTIFTTLYLMAVLPFFGLHLPMVKILIPLTFVAGLLPVVGNLISNTAIVLISLSVSSGAAMGSLAFLVGIHKLEYFFNARIVGGEVQASAWELLSAMLVMEAIFGIAGLIAAPVAYAWLKAELKAKNMI